MTREELEQYVKENDLVIWSRELSERKPMTDRMINALNHIKTSADVDPWAAEEVERVFKAIGDIKKEIQATIDEEKTGNGNINKGVVIGLQMALDTIDKYTESEESCDTCNHKDEEWDSDACDGCCGSHSGFEPQESEG